MNFSTDRFQKFTEAISGIHFDGRTVVVTQLASPVSFSCGTG